MAIPSPPPYADFPVFPPPRRPPWAHNGVASYKLASPPFFRAKNSGPTFYDFSLFFALFSFSRRRPDAKVLARPGRIPLHCLRPKKSLQTSASIPPLPRRIFSVVGRGRLSQKFLMAQDRIFPFLFFLPSFPGTCYPPPSFPPSPPEFPRSLSPCSSFTESRSVHPQALCSEVLFLT